MALAKTSGGPATQMEQGVFCVFPIGDTSTFPNFCVAMHCVQVNRGKGGVLKVLGG